MPLSQTLAETWSFAEAAPGASRAPKSGWRPARVPGNVHLDLVAAGLLSDPLVGTGEAAAAWVEQKDWWYRCRFRVEAGLLSARRVRLTAEGLDTWCTLWLNGHRLGRTETMFVEHVFEAGHRLKPGLNELLLRFESPARVLAALEKKHGYRPAIGDERRMHGRKAPYSFGWDWAPRLATSGVFKPVRLEALEDVRVSDFWVRTLAADAREARGEAHVEVEALRSGEASLALNLGTWTFRTSRRVKPGLNRFSFPWTLARPRLWWPRGWGEAHLYRAEVLLDGRPARTLDVGLRVVELERRADSAGESFGFRVNGRPVFAKGANWIPADSFLGRLKASRVEALLDRAVEANYSLLRVWGGGLFESEDFYRACDRRGLLVWQDFLFSCSEVPEHPDFKALVRSETETALRRLRRHPSLALLCGNNENHMARHDGWFRGRESKAWGGSLYEKVLPSLCARDAPGVPYWPGSPYGGADPNSQEQGDRHHWLVWSQLKDPDFYRTDRGRFLSEFGLASLPNRAALDAAIGPKGRRSAQGPELAAHDKDALINGGGLARLSLFVFRHLPYAPGLEAFRYLSQVFQSRGLQLGIEHWRRLKPHTQGALVWQHNDCWPALSWSLLDGMDQPKLAYYGVRRSFDDTLLSAFEAEIPPSRPGTPAGRGNCEVWLSLDGPRAVGGKLRVERWNMKGREAVLAVLDCRVPANGGRRLWSRSREACGVKDTSRQYLVARFLGEGSVERRCLLLFERPLRLALEPSAVTAGVRGKDGLVQVALNSPSLALSCEVSAPGAGHLDDNGFDLLPGETRVLSFRPEKAGPLRGAWGVKTLNQMAAACEAMP